MKELIGKHMHSVSGNSLRHTYEYTFKPLGGCLNGTHWLPKRI